MNASFSVELCVAHEAAEVESSVAMDLHAAKVPVEGQQDGAGRAVATHSELAAAEVVAQEGAEDTGAADISTPGHNAGGGVRPRIPMMAYVAIQFIGAL